MQEIVKETKTIEYRVDRILKMAKDHFGEVRFVGIKLHDRMGWVVEALKNLRKRVQKIIDRHNIV